MNDLAKKAMSIIDLLPNGPRHKASMVLSFAGETLASKHKRLETSEAFDSYPIQSDRLPVDGVRQTMDELPSEILYVQWSSMGDAIAHGYYVPGNECLYTTKKAISIFFEKKSEKEITDEISIFSWKRKVDQEF